MRTRFDRRLRDQLTDAAIHAPHVVLRARVSKAWHRGAIVALARPHHRLTERIFRREEGIMWVRGWDTEEALAFIVAESLR